MRGRKAQITVFILIGIMLLLATAFIFYMKDRFISEQISVELEMDKVEGDAKPVQDFVISCASQIAKEGIIRIGAHGGYISVSNNTLTTESFDIDERDYSESDAVQITDDYYVPYWYYLKAENECKNCPINKQLTPTVEKMQEELENYIGLWFDDCVDEFSVFEEQGLDVEEIGEPFFEAAIAESKVYVSINYPLKVTKEGVEHNLENSYVEIDVRLKQMYDLAKFIVGKELSTNFLENTVMNLISAYSGLSEEKLPPIYEFTEDYSVVYWVKSDVNEQVVEILNSYLPLIRIENTKGAEKIITEDEYEQSLFENIFVENEEDYNDFSAHFMYMNWPIYLDVTPNKGELIGPMTWRTEYPVPFVAPLQTNRYESFYDIAFPAVVFLRDDEAFAGEGFNFLFAMEGNLKDNIPVNVWNNLSKDYRPWSYDNIEWSVDDSLELVSGVDPETNETITAEFEPEPIKIMCKSNQKISGKISFSAYDKLTGEAIPEVGVTLKCGKYKNCFIGTTSSQGKLKDKSPICIGGAFLFDKEGYQTAIVEYDVVPEQDGVVIAELMPFREVQSSIKLVPTSRLDSSKSVQYIKGVAYDPARTDEVIMTGEKLPEHPFEKPVSIIVNFNGTNPETVSLLPGNYTLSFIYQDTEGIIIPEQEIEDVDPEDGVYPEINLTPAMLGGAYMNNVFTDNVTISNTTAYYWNVTNDNLDTFSNVYFYIFRMSDPRNVSMLEEMGMFEEYSMRFRDYIEPDFFNE